VFNQGKEDTAGHDKIKTSSRPTY